MIRLTHQKKDINKGPFVGPHDLPDSILSLHVDHGLQSDAEKMAHAARTTAMTLKADHSELRIPWGDPPFPPRPSGEGGGDAVESVARTARYRLIFDAMVRHRRHDDDDSGGGVRVLATGHHADDQVETVLMRLGSGSSILGLGGMRPVRRFGMALGKRDGDFGWFGHEGLHRWIVRPLLDVSKVSPRSLLSFAGE
jgi:tRNA(Ile)-lysidine synthase